jgi:hypothetical protein
MLIGYSGGDESWPVAIRIPEGYIGDDLISNVSTFRTGGKASPQPPGSRHLPNIMAVERSFSLN